MSWLDSNEKVKGNFYKHPEYNSKNFYAEYIERLEKAYEEFKKLKDGIVSVYEDWQTDDTAIDDEHQVAISESFLHIVRDLVK